MISLIPDGLLPWLAGAIIAIISAIGVYLKGRGDAKQKAENRAMKEAQATRERMRNADSTYEGTDFDTIRERMRERGERG